MYFGYYYVDIQQFQIPIFSDIGPYQNKTVRVRQRFTKIYNIIQTFKIVLRS